jgi:DNA-binding XRE family transcriptional regulator
MNLQVIEKNGKPEWAVIPYESYLKLVENAEMSQDIRDYHQAKQVIEAGEEVIPSHVTYAILDGENPIKVWREYRQLSRQALATQVGITENYLSDIEAGKSMPTIDILVAIAKVLNLDVEDITDF